MLRILCSKYRTITITRSKTERLCALDNMRNLINKNKQDGDKPEDGIAFDLHGTE